MRHSDPKLTANVYTDPQLLDVAGALEALPSLPLDTTPEVESQIMTGTDAADVEPGDLAPDLAPTPDNSGQSVSIPDMPEGRHWAAPGQEPEPPESP